MTSKTEAKEKLRKSLNNLYNRQGVINARELEKEVIYMCCYEVIKIRKKKTSVDSDLLLVSRSFNDSLLDIVPISIAYSEAAVELFPNVYNPTNVIIVTEAIKNNIFEDNMWNILKDCYLEKHGYDIDYALFEEGGVPKFKMKSLRQIDNINRTLNENIDITISFIGEDRIFVTVGEEFKELAVNISMEDMSNLEYKNINERYKFIIRYDESFNPSSFVVINQQDNRMIEYYYK